MPSSKKTANGGGSIRKKTVMKNGKAYTYWEARVTVSADPMTGKQRQRSITGKTQQEVAQKLRQLTAEIDNGTYREPSKMTVGEWLDTWQEQYLNDLKPLTKEMYATAVRIHLKPAFGMKKLDTLLPIDIQQFYNSLMQGEKPLSAKTIKNIHGIFHRALQQALDLGYLRNNPANPCRLPRVEKPIIHTLDDVSTKKFLKAIQGHRFENLFLVTLFTGLREGEVLGLKWDCVDFTNGSLLVGRQLQRKRDGSSQYYLISPKSGKFRKVVLAPFVLDILHRQRAEQEIWKRIAGKSWMDTGLVFTDELGDNLTPETVYKNFKKIAIEIGCESLHFHSLRHSYAVAALQSGDDIKTVQENLGHYTAAFTLDVYGHVTDKMRQDSADRMQKYIDILHDE
ncbi:site-specific integrase [Acutalibacter sp. JLR.KK004]|uniref:tyrosine-type recombinase/integrase n=1 Tax=Acutalibacter sp. JLR.KK004 TaxID=3112622 RepID=UPI002FF23E50